MLASLRPTPVTALPFRFDLKQIHRQINALRERWRRAGPGPWRMIPVAAGERIVAFERPGKPPGSRFWTPD